MIRQAVPADKNRVVQLLENSRIGAGFDSPSGTSGFVFPFDPKAAAQFFAYHVRSPNAVCLLLEIDGIAQGILAATAFPHPYGPVSVAKESMWWIEPEHRGGTAAVRMLDAFEMWARRRGCQFTGVAGMGDDPRVGALYERRGYRGAEVHYLKAL